MEVLGYAVGVRALDVHSSMVWCEERLDALSIKLLIDESLDKWVY